jgi:outer membrane receptor protein involved in Fe transport
MRASALTIGMLVACAVRSAQGFDGRVLLPDGTPAAYASVSVLGVAGSTRTGPDGRFAVQTHPLPPFEMLVVLAGGIYAKPTLIRALPREGDPIEIRVDFASSEHVTVESGTTPFTDLAPANAATTVVGSDLDQRHPENLAETIAIIPGAGFIGGGHSAVPSIRGFGRGRALIMLDGARVSAERRAGPSATFLDPYFLEAVEVARGFGGVAYGSDAFGGVMHARTHRPTAGSPLKAQLQGTLGAGAPERSMAARLTAGSFLLQSRYRRFNDYRTPEGPQPDSGFRNYGFQMRWVRRLGPGQFDASWQSDMERDVGKPSTDSAVVGTSYPVEDSHRLTLTYDGEPRKWLPRWALTAFSGIHSAATQRERYATAEQGREVQRSDLRAWDFGSRLSGTTSYGDWRIQAGMELNGRAGLHSWGTFETDDPAGMRSDVVSETSIDDASRSDAALYASLDGNLTARVSTSVGLRLDVVSSSNRRGYFGDRNTNGTAVSGYVSVTAAPCKGTTVTGQVGSGFRDPTLSDRYYRGITGRGFITGLPDLKPERSLQYDVAVRRTGRVRTLVYFYRYEISRLIERYRTNGDYVFRNRGRACVRGVELEAQADIGAGFSFDLGAQSSSGRALDDDAPLDDIQARSMTMTLRKALGWAATAYIRGGARARHDRPGPNEVTNAAYFTVDAAATLRMSSSMELLISIKNVLDCERPQTPDEISPLAPGRAFSVTLRSRLFSPPSSE